MFEETDRDAFYDRFRDEEGLRYTIGTPLTRSQTWRTFATYLGHRLGHRGGCRCARYGRNPPPLDPSDPPDRSAKRTVEGRGAATRRAVRETTPFRDGAADSFAYTRAAA